MLLVINILVGLLVVMIMVITIAWLAVASVVIGCYWLFSDMLVWHSWLVRVVQVVGWFDYNVCALAIRCYSCFNG